MAFWAKLWGGREKERAKKAKHRKYQRRGFQIERLEDRIVMNADPIVLAPLDATEFNAGVGGVFVAPSATVEDDSANFDGGKLTVSLTNAQTGDDLTLRDAAGISVVDNNGVQEVWFDDGGSQLQIGTLTLDVVGEDLEVSLNADATADNVQSLVRAVAFEQTGTLAGPDRSIDVTLNDGDAVTPGETTITRTIQITPSAGTNDAPVHHLPGSLTTDSDTPIVFSTANGNAITVTDQDAGIHDISVSLSVSYGTLTLGDVQGDLTSISGDGTSYVDITGDLASINTVLEGLTYTPDYPGFDSLSLSTNDNGFYEDDGYGGAGYGGNAQYAYDSLSLEVTQAPQPAISVTDEWYSEVYDDASNVHFGSTNPGTPLSHTFTINNSGAEDLTLANLASDSSLFTIISAPAATVAAGGSTTFTIEFDSTTGGYFNANITLDTNVPGAETFNFAVAADAVSVSPEIEVYDENYSAIYDAEDPNSYGGFAFGQTAEGTPVTKYFYIENYGDGDLTLTGLTLPSGFSIASDFSSTVIAPYSSASFAITFDATATGVTQGELSFTTNDADEGTFNFNIEAEATAPNPEVEVFDENYYSIYDAEDPSNTGPFDFGQTPQGTAVTKSFTIENQGVDNLTLSGLTLPAGFSIASGFSSTTIASYSSATFSITYDASTVGIHEGELSFTTNDLDEGTFNFDIRAEATGTPTPAPEVAVFDDGSNGLYDAEDPSHYEFNFGQTPQGVTVTRQFTVENTGDADLTLSGVALPSGFSLAADFSATTVLPNSSATFSVTYDATAVGVDSGELSFMTNDLDEGTFNFSIRAEATGTPTPAPEIQVFDDNTAEVFDAEDAMGGGVFDFGQAADGVPVSRQFSITNSGDADLTLSTLTPPSGFSITSGFDSVVLPGATTDFTLTYDAAGIGVVEGELSFTTNDADEATFNFTVRGEVTAPVPIAIENAGLLNDTGDSSSDLITSDPTLTGQVTGDFGAGDVRVEFDHNGDGVVDGSVVVSTSGDTFQYDPRHDAAVASHLGSLTIQYRAVHVENSVEDAGAWQSVSFTLEEPFVAVRLAVEDVELLRDTGSSAHDKITTSAVLTGLVNGDWQGGSAEIAFDTTGDGIANHTITVDESDPRFLFDPQEFDPLFGANPGAVSVQYQVTVYNSDGLLDSTGSWQAFTFELEALPEGYVGFSDVYLYDGEGSVNWSSTVKEPVLKAKAGYEGGGSLIEVEFDTDGDGIADDWLITSPGEEFEYQITGLPEGQHSISMRTKQWSESHAATLISSWSTSYEFTLETPAPNIAEIRVAAVPLEDGESYEGEEDSEPVFDSTLTGKLDAAADDVDTVKIEFDHDGDDVIDGHTWTDAEGNFDYNPGLLPGGGVTVRARSVIVVDGVEKTGAWYSAYVDIDRRETPDNVLLTLKNDDGVDVSDGITSDSTVNVWYYDAESGDVIEFDHDGDDVADGHIVVTDATSVHEVDYKPLGISAGPATIRSRAVVWDDAAGENIYGAWSQVTFTYAPAPFESLAIEDFTVAINSSEVETEVTTSSPFFSGQVTGEDKTLAGQIVEFDHDADGLVDGSVLTRGDGSFFYTATGLAAGLQTIASRTKEWDYDNNTYVYSGWTTLEFTLEEPPVVAGPAIANLRLLSDSGVAGDNITANTTITGELENADTLPGLYMEFDHNGDGQVDSYGFVDSDNTFTHDPFALSLGANTVAARASWWDAEAGVFAVGAWETLSFTYEHQVNAAAQIVSLTNEAGELNDVDLKGLISNEGDLAGVTIEFDFTGDGLVERVSTTNDKGEFATTLRNAQAGDITIAARTREFDAQSKQFLYGAWNSLTFTHTAVVNTPAAVQSFTHSADGGYDAATDTVTAATVAVEGVVSNDGELSGLVVQFDTDGDDLIDAETYTDDTGAFSYEFSGLEAGAVSIRARVRESSETAAATYSAWSDLTFTLETPAEDDTTPDEPGIASFGLTTDSGADVTDGATAFASVTGSISGYDSPSDVTIAIFGDGVYETVKANADGTFNYTPTTLAAGRTKLDARIVSTGDNDQSVYLARRQSVEFVYAQDPDSAATQAIVDGYNLFETQWQTAQDDYQTELTAASNDYRTRRQNASYAYEASTASARGTLNSVLRNNAENFDAIAAIVDKDHTDAIKAANVSFSNSMASFVGDASTFAMPEFSVNGAGPRRITAENGLDQDANNLDTLPEAPSYTGESFELEKSDAYKAATEKAKATLTKETDAVYKQYLANVAQKYATLEEQTNTANATYDTDLAAWKASNSPAAVSPSVITLAKTAYAGALTTAKNEYDKAVKSANETFEQEHGDQYYNDLNLALPAVDTQFTADVDAAQAAYDADLYASGAEDTYYAALADAYKKRAEAYADKLYGDEDATAEEPGEDADELFDGNAGVRGDYGNYVAAHLKRARSLSDAAHARREKEYIAQETLEKAQATYKHQLNTARIEYSAKVHGGSAALGIGSSGDATANVTKEKFGKAGLAEIRDQAILAAEKTYEEAVAIEWKSYVESLDQKYGEYAITVATAARQELQTWSDQENSAWKTYQLNLASNHLDYVEAIYSSDSLTGENNSPVTSEHEADETRAKARIAGIATAASSKIRARLNAQVAKTRALRVYNTAANDALKTREQSNATSWKDHLVARSEARNTMQRTMALKQATFRYDSIAAMRNRLGGDAGDIQLWHDLIEDRDNGISPDGFHKPYISDYTPYGPFSTLTQQVSGAYITTGHFDSHEDLNNGDLSTYSTIVTWTGPATYTNVANSGDISSDAYLAYNKDLIDAKRDLDKGLVNAKKTYAKTRNDKAAAYEVGYYTHEKTWRHSTADAQGDFETSLGKAAAGYAYDARQANHQLDVTFATVDVAWWTSIGAYDKALAESQANARGTAANDDAEDRQTFETAIAEDYASAVSTWHSGLNTSWSGYHSSVATAEKDQVLELAAARVVQTDSLATAAVTWTVSAATSNETYYIALANADKTYATSMQGHLDTAAGSIRTADENYTTTVAEDTTQHDQNVVDDNLAFRTAIINEQRDLQNAIDAATYAVQLRAADRSHTADLSINTAAGHYAKGSLSLTSYEGIRDSANSNRYGDSDAENDTRLETIANAARDRANNVADKRKAWVTAVHEEHRNLASNKLTATTTYAGEIETAYTTLNGHRETATVAHAAAYADAIKADTIAYAQADGANQISIVAADGTFSVAAATAAGNYDKTVGQALDDYDSTSSTEIEDKLTTATATDSNPVRDALREQATASRERIEALAPSDLTHRTGIAAASVDHAAAVAAANNLSAGRLYDTNGSHIEYVTAVATADLALDEGIGAANAKRNKLVSNSAHAYHTAVLIADAAYPLGVASVTKLRHEKVADAQVDYVSTTSDAWVNWYLQENGHTGTQQLSVSDDNPAISLINTADRDAAITAAATTRTDAIDTAYDEYIIDVHQVQVTRVGSLGAALTAHATTLGGTEVTYVTELNTADAAFQTAVTDAVADQAGALFDDSYQHAKDLATAAHALSTGLTTADILVKSTQKSAQADGAHANGQIQADMQAALANIKSTAVSATGDSTQSAIATAEANFQADMQPHLATYFKERSEAFTDAHVSQLTGQQADSQSQFDLDSSLDSALHQANRDAAVEAARRGRDFYAEESERIGARRLLLAQASETQLITYAQAEETRATTVADVNHTYVVAQVDDPDEENNTPNATARNNDTAKATRDERYAQIEADRTWRMALVAADLAYLQARGIAEGDFAADVAQDAIDHQADIENLLNDNTDNEAEAAADAAIAAAQREAAQSNALAAAEAKYMGQQIAKEADAKQEIATSTGVPYAQAEADIAAERLTWYESAGGGKELYLTYNANLANEEVIAAQSAKPHLLAYTARVEAAEASATSQTQLLESASVSGLNILSSQFQQDIAAPYLAYANSLTTADAVYYKALADIDYQEQLNSSYDEEAARTQANKTHNEQVKAAKDAFNQAVATPASNTTDDTATEDEATANNIVDVQAANETELENARHDRDAALAQIEAAKQTANAVHTKTFVDGLTTSYSNHLQNNLSSDTPWHQNEKDTAQAEANHTTSTSTAFETKTTADAEAKRDEVISKSAATRDQRIENTAAGADHNKRTNTATKTLTEANTLANAPLPQYGKQLTTLPTIAHAPLVFIADIAATNTDAYFAKLGDDYGGESYDSTFNFGVFDESRHISTRQKRIDSTHSTGDQLGSGLSRRESPNSAIDLNTRHLQACFVAGTPIRTPEGSKPIEQIEAGDTVLARPEKDATGPIRPRLVEETFKRSSHTLKLVFASYTIETTAEHPFYVQEKGWTSAGELTPGELLITDQEEPAQVLEIATVDEITSVFNMRVAEDHTYFVGEESWNAAVWAHNVYNPETGQEEARDVTGQVVVQSTSPAQHYIPITIRAVPETVQKLKEEIARLHAQLKQQASTGISGISSGAFHSDFIPVEDVQEAIKASDKRERDGRPREARYYEGELDNKSAHRRKAMWEALGNTSLSWYYKACYAPGARLGKALYGDTVPHDKYVTIITNVAGTATVLVLERYKIGKPIGSRIVTKSVAAGVGARGHSTNETYKHIIRAPAKDYYRIVMRKKLGDASNIERLQTIQQSNNHIEAAHQVYLSDSINNVVSAIELTYRIIPFGNGALEASDGNYWEAGISFAGDIAMFATMGAGTLAQGSRAALILGTLGKTGDIGVAIYRGVEAYNSLGKDDWKAAASFGEAAMLLFGLSMGEINALRQARHLALLDDAITANPKLVTELSQQLLGNAKAAGNLSEEAIDTLVQLKKAIHTLEVIQDTCFAAGTPVQTPSGPKAIEDFVAGDEILSRAEHDPDAPVRTSFVEKVFKLSAPILELRLGGQVIETTAKHPFFVQGKGWTAAFDLEEGDLVVGQHGELTPVESISETGRDETVYNLRVTEDHTYFVGGDEWGFSAWVHNDYEVVKVREFVYQIVNAETKVPTGPVFSSQAKAQRFVDSLPNTADTPLVDLLGKDVISYAGRSPALARARVGRTVLRLQDNLVGTSYARFYSTLDNEGVDAAYRIIRDAYGDTPIHPLLRDRLKDFLRALKEGSALRHGIQGVGTVGTHAEVRAFNEALFLIDKQLGRRASMRDLHRITLGVRHTGSGGWFPRCYNCRWPLFDVRTLNDSF